MMQMHGLSRLFLFLFVLVIPFSYFTIITINIHIIHVIYVHHTSSPQSFGMNLKETMYQ